MATCFKPIACAATSLTLSVWLSSTAKSQAPSNREPDRASIEKQFRNLCAGCHGTDAAGGDRGPALKNSRSLRASSEDQILAKIREGTPGGMPAFPLPADQLHALASWVRSLNSSAFDTKP